ncbi:hypothetical protein P9112_000165 [Eukaryota sp. TZLM1-RC]
MACAPLERKQNTAVVQPSHKHRSASPEVRSFSPPHKRRHSDNEDDYRIKVKRSSSRHYRRRTITVFLSN